MRSCDKPCSGCAFSPGAEANLEPHNNLIGMIALLAPLPFYCHSGFDYKDKSITDRVTRAKFRETGIVLCAGWLREVARLAKTGYYKENPQETRIYGRIAHAELKNFIAADEAGNDEERQGALRTLEEVLIELNRKRLKFTGEINL